MKIPAISPSDWFGFPWLIVVLVYKCHHLMNNPHGYAHLLSLPVNKPRIRTSLMLTTCYPRVCHVCGEMGKTGVGLAALTLKRSREKVQSNILGTGSGQSWRNSDIDTQKTTRMLGVITQTEYVHSNPTYMEEYPLVGCPVGAALPRYHPCFI